MAHISLPLVFGVSLFSLTTALTTCPGFPGYCSESFPGQSCNVVCSFGRNNVPLCQDDGTWTDIPRCVEHEPGVDEQIPGICPGIPGYCAQGFLNHRCQFDCRTGVDINSMCTSDGTWQPYPTCEGDLRETRDGCDGCPGPVGSARNRTAENALAAQGLGPRKTINSRIPKAGSIDTGRRQVPSFAGNTRFGSIRDEEREDNSINNFRVSADGRIQQGAAAIGRQTPNIQRPAPAVQQPAVQRPAPAVRRPAPVPQRRQNPPAQNFQTSFQQQGRQQPQQQMPQRFQPQQGRQQQMPQQGFQQGLNTFQPNGLTNQPLVGGLFNQIKNRINQGNQERAQQQSPNSIQQQPQPVAAQASLPVQPFLPEPQQARPTPRQPQQAGSQQTFGPFQAVSLGNSLSGSQQRRIVPSPQPTLVERPAQNDNFFGEFATVNLQG